MPGSTPKVSPALQTLIDKGLLDGLPVTFSAFCLDQMKEWELLFPAERGYYERLFGLLDRSTAQAVEGLFAPVREIERKMGANDRTWPKGEFSLEQVDFLNRSPHYAEWRAAISQVFARIDPLLDAEVARAGHARLVVVIAPQQLPVGPDRLWTRVQDHGKRVAVEPPERAEDYVPLLLTGAPAGAASIGKLFAVKATGGLYSSWVVETSGLVSRLEPNTGPVVKYSYEALEPYRKRLMKEVQSVVDAQEVPGPRQLSARLKQMKILASEGNVASDPILAEFARAILLSGNGTLLINNTFVEWATVQAIRRARPSVLVAGFGIRNKIKPFSSLLIYADQETSNPIPSQMDALGSYVDLEVFYQYIWQECEKYVEYRKNTAYLLVADGMDEMLVIAPSDFPLLAASGPIKLPAVFQHLKDWLSV